MNCQPWRQGNCSYGNWIAVVTPASYCNSWNNFAVRMGQECLHVKKKKRKKSEMGDMQRKKEFSTLSHFMFHLQQCRLLCLSFPWWRRENKGQGSAPHFRLLVWLLTHIVMLPCTHFIRPFQHPTHCERRGKICFRALTPRSPLLRPAPRPLGDIWVI